MIHANAYALTEHAREERARSWQAYAVIMLSTILRASP